MVHGISDTSHIYIFIYTSSGLIKFRINEGVDNQFTIYHMNYIFLPVMVVVDSKRSRYNDCYRVINLRSPNENE